MSYKKQMKLVLREKVKRRLWNRSIACKVKNYPVDIETKTGHRIMVETVKLRNPVISIDPEKLKYADVIAICLISFGKSQTIIFGKSSSFEGLKTSSLTEKNQKSFAVNPKEIIDKIKPKKLKLPPVKLIESEWYTLRTIAENRLFREQTSMYMLKKWIKTKFLRSVCIPGKRGGKRYLIKGKWIIEAIAKLDNR